jgi:hypothetical protein
MIFSRRGGALLTHPAVFALYFQKKNSLIALQIASGEAKS